MITDGYLIIAWIVYFFGIRTPFIICDLYFAKTVSESTVSVA